MTSSKVPCTICAFERESTDFIPCAVCSKEICRDCCEHTKDKMQKHFCSFCRSSIGFSLDKYGFLNDAPVWNAAVTSITQIIPFMKKHPLMNNFLEKVVCLPDIHGRIMDMIYRSLESGEQNDTWKNEFIYMVDICKQSFLIEYELDLKRFLLHPGRDFDQFSSLLGAYISKEYEIFIEGMYANTKVVYLEEQAAKRKPEEEREAAERARTAEVERMTRERQEQIATDNAVIEKLVDQFLISPGWIIKFTETVVKYANDVPAEFFGEDQEKISAIKASLFRARGDFFEIREDIPQYLRQQAMSEKLNNDILMDKWQSAVFQRYSEMENEMAQGHHSGGSSAGPAIVGDAEFQIDLDLFDFPMGAAGPAMGAAGPAIAMGAAGPAVDDSGAGPIMDRRDPPDDERATRRRRVERGDGGGPI